MPDALDAMPSSFAAGTTVKLRRSLADFPASAGWTYELFLRGAGALDADGTADGDDFLVTIPATGAGGTAGLAAGTYRWLERLTKAGEVYDGDTGVVAVTIDLGAAAAGDAQTHAERSLALIEAAIEGRIPEGMESYQVAGRAVSKIPIADLVKLRGLYAAQVATDRNGGQLGRVQLVFRG